VNSKALIRFRSKVQRGATEGDCDVWTGQKTVGGYGRFDVGGRPRHAHRVVWEVRHGRIPAGMFVCHRCDNRLCVKLGHLFLGTHKDNMADMAAKHRAAHGERHTFAKLTEAQVAEIRARYAAGGVRQVDLAREYGVSQVNISHVVRGTTWRHGRAA
jgi:hypothetical protein